MPISVTMQVKKKAQQEAASKRTGSNAAQARAAAVSTPTQADASNSDVSEEEEDQDTLSLRDSRFASLMIDSGQGVDSQSPQGSQQGAAGGSQQGAQTVVGQTAADSENEAEEGQFVVLAFLLSPMCSMLTVYSTDVCEYDCDRIFFHEWSF